MKFPKIIWLLWYQGWEHAPWISQNVLKSWKRHNPDWQVILVSKDNLSGFVTIEEKPNIPCGFFRCGETEFTGKIRRYLGRRKMLCMEPLNNWVWEALAPCGFWMYHGRDNCKGPASWFILSSNESLLIQDWKTECDKYWKQHDTVDYFWMDSIFEDKRHNDKQFKTEWEKVPHLCCEDLGSAHFAGRVNTPPTDEFKKHINENKVPHAIKLSNKQGAEEGANSIATYLVEISNKKIRGFSNMKELVLPGIAISFTSLLTRSFCGDLTSTPTVAFQPRHGFLASSGHSCTSRWESRGFKTRNSRICTPPSWRFVVSGLSRIRVSKRGEPASLCL